MQASIGLDSLPEHEQLVPCPYNNAHLVVFHRMPKHLIKCRKSNGTSGTKECRFNSSHVLPMCEIMYHESTCPDRILIDSFLMNRSENRQHAPKTEDHSSNYSKIKSGDKTVKDEEASDWDEISVSSYKPYKNY